MKSQIKRIAQAPPPPPEAAPPPPPAGGDAMPPPDMMGGMGGMLPSPAPMGAGGPPAPPTDIPKLSLFPIESSGQLLVDAEIEKRLKEQFATNKGQNITSEEEIANEIWMEYGGNELGGVDRNKRGKRLSDKEVDQDEIKRTKDRKWERLLQGKNLDDLKISLEDIKEMVIAISHGLAASKKKEAPAGGAPAIANLKMNDLIRLAKDIYSNSSNYKF